MKSKILTTVAIILVGMGWLWILASYDIGIHSLIISAIVIIAVFFGLIKAWESRPKSKDSDEPSRQ